MDGGSDLEYRARAIAGGDAAAFGDLFDDASSDVYAYCLHRCGDPTVAEDLMSVVFLEAWRTRAGAVLIEDSLRPWLFGIAKNVLRHSRRSARRHRQALDRYHAANPDLTEPDHADGVAASVTGSAATAALRSALTSLSAKERDVAELCLLGEMTTRAAAAVLKLPEGTVKSRLARARRRMQRVLRSGEFADPSRTSGHVPGERRRGAPTGVGQRAWIQR